MNTESSGEGANRIGRSAMARLHLASRLAAANRACRAIPVMAETEIERRERRVEIDDLLAQLEASRLPGASDEVLAFAPDESRAP